MTCAKSRMSVYPGCMHAKGFLIIMVRLHCTSLRRAFNSSLEMGIAACWNVIWSSPQLSPGKNDLKQLLYTTYLTSSSKIHRIQILVEYKLSCLQINRHVMK